MNKYNLFSQIKQYNPNANWDNYKDKSAQEIFRILQSYQNKSKKNTIKLVKALKPDPIKTDEFGNKQVRADNGQYEDYID